MRPATSRLVLAASLAGALLAGRAARGDPPATTAPESGRAPPAGPTSGATPAPGRPVLDGPDLRLRLEDALLLGLERNLELAAGAYGPVIARDSVTVQEGAFDTLLTAGFSGGRRETLPNVSFYGVTVLQEDYLTGDVGFTRRLTTGGTLGLVFHADRLSSSIAIATTNPRWASGAAVEYVQPLLRGAGDVATADLRRARNGARASQETFLALTDDVLLRTEAAYWNLVFFRAQVVARRASEDVARALLDQTQVRFDARVATVLDLAEARAGMENRRGDRILADGLAAQAEDDLRALILPFDPTSPARISITALDDPHATPPGEAIEALSEDRCVAQAARARPDLLAARAELENRGIDVDVARNELLPQLDLVARLQTDGLEGGWWGAWGEAAGIQAGTASLGLDFSVYIGRRSAKARLSMAEGFRRQGVLQVRELENRIVAEVRAARREIETARARVASATEEIRSAREALDGEKLKEESGQSTPFHVLEKEESLTQAVTRENRAAVDVRIGTARLWKAMGSLAQARRVRPPAPGR